MTNKIILCFAGNEIGPGGVYWFQPPTAVRVIEKARETKTPILGFRAARIGRDGIHESLEDSWNYVLALPPIKNTHNHAIDFIAARLASGLSFEVILPELIGSGALIS